MFHTGDCYPLTSRSDVVPSSPDRRVHAINPAVNRDPNKGIKNIVCNGGGGGRANISEQRAKGPQDNPSEHGGSRQEINEPMKAPLHKTLYQNFRHELTSLSAATEQAIQLSCQEQERLCLTGEELESRIAYLRNSVRLKNKELMEKGIIGKETEGQLSLVQEGEYEKSFHNTLNKVDESCDSAEVTGPESTMKKINSSQGALQANIVSKRFGRFSVLHGSHTTVGSNASGDAPGMPHISRSSLLGMLGTSKSWLDQSNRNEESAREAAPVFRLSFVDGVGDGMPSRWRAREQERKKSEQQNRAEEEGRASIDERKDGGEEKTTYSPKMEEKLQNLISRREWEISTLEKQASSVNEQISSLQDEVYVLKKDQRKSQDEFDQERTKLLGELDQVESDNDKLEYMLVETGVISDEKKIIMEILANELKAVREELAVEQIKRDRRKAEQKRRERARRWSWMTGSPRDSRLEPKQEKTDQQKRKMKEKERASSAQQGQEEVMSRYQVPSDALQRYQILTGGGSETESSDGGGGQMEGGRSLDRRESQNSIGTIMSALTLDSSDMVDILEQLELDK